jgi:hypothetical protein
VGIALGTLPPLLTSFSWLRSERQSSPRQREAPGGCLEWPQLLWEPELQGLGPGQEPAPVEVSKRVRYWFAWCGVE